MHWVRSHPYLVALALAALLMLVGIIIVTMRSDVGTQIAAPRTWDISGANFADPIGQSSLQNTNAGEENLYSQVRSGPPFHYITLPTPSETTEEPSDGFDFEGFLASLTRPKANVSANVDTSLDAYAFIPGGLISTSTPPRAKTETQSAIYEYGNDAGSYIQSYDEQYRSAPQILKDQFEDRENAAKNARLAGLGEAMAEVGRALQRSDIVPPSFEAANAKLGKSYVDMGANLKAITIAKSDKTLLDAILAYNASVEAFTKNYVALATLFSAYGVSFKADEPGAVFMFTNASF